MNQLNCWSSGDVNSLFNIILKRLLEYIYIYILALIGANINLKLVFKVEYKKISYD